MNRSILLYAVLLTLTFSCKSKKSYDSTKAYFSVVSYLQAQVKQTDSLPLQFTKITMADSTADTSAISKDEFHTYAKEFLDIPDISSDENMDQYEEDNTFEDILNNVLLTYTAKNDKEEVRRETIMMEADEQGNTHVKTILINTIQVRGDAVVEKDMTWHIDRRFQIVTKTRKPNQPEKINTLIVKWDPASN
jgi:hypothetical protein